MLSLGKDADKHVTENLKKILNHLNKLKTYEEMGKLKRQTGMTEDDILILLLLFFDFLFCYGRRK